MKTQTGRSEDDEPQFSLVRRYVIQKMDRAAAQQLDDQPGSFHRPPTLAAPLYRAIIVVDIEGSTTRVNADKAQIRQLMYDLVETALTISGVDLSQRDPIIDRGDGALILIHPSDTVPKTHLLTRFLPYLENLLAIHGTCPTGQPLRLRVAIHAGEVHYDQHGVFSQAVDVCCRLLDCSDLKDALKETTKSIVLIISDYIYRAVVRHHYAGISQQSFEPVSEIRIADESHIGWIHRATTKPRDDEDTDASAA